MIRSVLTVLALVAAAPFAVAGDKFWVYLGTYTGKDRGKGIYRCEFDAATGKLSRPEVAAEITNPTFLAVAPDGKTLYSVGEVGNQGARKNEGGVTAFRIDPATGGLTRLNGATTGGAGPCHIATDKEGKFAIAANYGGGSTAVFRLKPDGAFDGRTDFVQHSGPVHLPKRQGGPHAHCGFFDDTGTFALVCDLGLDKVLVFKLDRDTGKLSDAGAVKLPPGSGPRHLHLAPAQDVMFVNGEIDCTVHVVKLHLPTAKWEVVQSLSTLPAGQTVTPADSTAEVRIHPSGKFVYVSNRGPNSIAAFRWDGSTLTPIGHASEGIKIPRNFNIDPSGRWMLVANQDGASVAVFEIGADGLPKPTGMKVEVPNPVCVKFLAKP